MRKQRKYAPFVKQGKRWYRAGYSECANDPMYPDMVRKVVYPAMKKDAAIRFYQSWLLAPFLNGIDEIRELRPVKD